MQQDHTPASPFTAVHLLETAITMAGSPDAPSRQVQEVQMWLLPAASSVFGTCLGL